LGAISGRHRIKYSGRPSAYDDAHTLQKREKLGLSFRLFFGSNGQLLLTAELGSSGRRRGTQNVSWTNAVGVSVKARALEALGSGLRFFDSQSSLPKENRLLFSCADANINSTSVKSVSR
jgi:hypothetical protein